MDKRRELQEAETRLTLAIIRVRVAAARLRRVLLEQEAITRRVIAAYRTRASRKRGGTP